MAIPGPATNSRRESNTANRIDIRDMVTLSNSFDFTSVLNGCFTGVPLKGTPETIGWFRGP